MTQETIVAAFDSAVQADDAARAVEAAGIPAANITQHAGTSTYDTTTTTDVTPVHKERGFWSRLFGDDEDDNYVHGSTTLRDHSVYDKTMAGGGSVLSVKVDNVERDGDRILNIIDSYGPIDIEERATSYAGTTATSTAPLATGTGNENQTIQLAEEALVVGKRVVNRGTTRIRRYVVETPVSEDVSLRQENVSIERRPIAGTGTVGADAFTDKTIEVTEMNEEAVVGKTASVVEEVVIRKDVNDRVETVRDTVRREELEVEKTDDLKTGGITGTPTKAA